MIASRLGIFLLIVQLADSCYGAVWSWSGGGGANANWNNSANWGFAGIPANGDTVIFPNSQPNELNTNNIAGLVLNQIRFVGAGGGYDIRGNAFTLTNSIIATNTAGANTIENLITLATTDVLMVVSNGVSLTLDGNLGGSVGVTKAGLGTLLYQCSGANTYTGTTLVSGGTLQFNVSGVNAVSGPLVIGDGTGANSPTVEDLQYLEMDNLPSVTINLNGTLNLNNFNEPDFGSMTLGGGTIQTGTGTLTFIANSTITTTSGNSSTIFGNLNTGSGTLTLQGDGNLSVYAVVSGSANIVQNDSVNTVWNAANTYTGNYTANGSGYVDLVNAYALGNTNNALTLNGQAWVAVYGNINITNQSLTINSTNLSSVWSAYGTIYVYGNTTNSWTANFTNNSASTTMDVLTNCGFNLDGPMAGSAGFTETGAGTLTLSGATANTYAGTTTVSGGTLLLGKSYAITAIPGPLFIGSSNTVRLLNSFQIYTPATKNPVTLSDSSLLDLAGLSDWVGPISLQGAQITAGAGTLYFSGNITVNGSTVAQSVISGNAQIYDGTYTITSVGHNYSPDLVISANVSSGGSGSPGLIKTGGGEVSLTGNNSFTGPVTINGGDLWAQTSTALGNTNTPATVNNGGTLFLYGTGLDFGLKPLVLNGAGYGFGALSCSGSSSWEGDVTLGSDSTIYPFGGASLTLAGAIGGGGGIIMAGPGTLTYAGTTANTYAGLTTVSAGTLVLNKTTAIAGVPGNLVVNNSATVLLASYEQTVNSADVLVNSGGLFDFGSFNTYMDTLHGAGTVNFGVGGWIWIGLNNGTSEFDGSFTGTGYAPGWTVAKTGTGTFTIGGNSTYTAGITHVNGSGGKLVINGSQPLIPVTVDAGTTLGGSGTVGTILANGTIAPGNSLGILNSGSVTFNSSGNFTENLAGPTLGGGYSQLNVAGTVSLANATLAVVPAFTTPVSIGQQFTILNNDGTDPITGTFNGLPEGSLFTAGAYKFRISYVGGTGNDVMLTLTGIPGAVAGAAVTAGNGNHAIDPDECNSLDLVITNNGATPMSNISATLSTTTEGVLITQPYSDYADIAGNGNGTNTTPFQISTLPGFICGLEIDLQMSVNSSLGSFTTPFVLPTGETSAASFRYDVTGDVAIPDLGAVDSTNSVSEFTGFPLDKVVVSLYLSDSLDSDLTNISLIAPDGTTVLLSSANGDSGQDYGSGLTPDSSRTTFDDAASTPITSGVAPFVGTFSPQSPLSAFIGNATPNGNWRLHIANGLGGGVGTLHGWSLFLYPVACGDGGGSCDVCMSAIADAITAGSNVQTNRWYRDGTVASCGSPKAWLGFGDTGPDFHYNAYAFTNTTGADACVTIELQSTNDVMAATYLYGYDATSISNNFWGDAGISTAEADAGITTYSSEIPAGAQFVVVVNEVAQAAGTQPYTLTLSGLPCPPPVLNIQPVTPNQAHLYWPTWAGGYLLEATPSLTNTTWTGITNEPIAGDSQFNVTNTMNPTNQFYRLHKP
jgi:autotransporter-associated beta strand protein